MVQARIGAAQAVAQRMHAAQALLERHRALHRSAHHVQARLAVAAVAGGTFDVQPGALQAIERDAIGGRIEGGRHEGLHAMCDGVHAGRGCQLGWQAEREFRVADGRLGHQEPAVETQLAVVVDDDDGAARHLAAGAAGGRHGDQRRHAVGDLRRATLDGGVGRERAFVRGGNRHALGAVDGRAAADCDQPVATAGVVGLDGGAHGGLGRVGRRLVEHRDFEPAQRIERLLQDAGGTHAGVGHDQRAGDADAGTFGCEQTDCAEFELDLGQVLDEGHGAVFL